MKVIEKIRSFFAEYKQEGAYSFILFSAALIFGVFLWRQRLLALPLSFSFRVLGNNLGSHIVYYLVSFIEVPLYAISFIFGIWRLSLWASAKFGLSLAGALRSFALHCLWFYLLPVNYYLTNGYSAPYPNHLAGNSPNPYLTNAPGIFPMDFIGVTSFFLFFTALSVILLSKGISSFSDERIFDYLAVFLGGFSAAVFLSFILRNWGGELYFSWYFLVILGVWFLYDYLSGMFAHRDFLPMPFLLLVLLPLSYRLIASFGANIYFYALVLLPAAAIIAYYIKNIRTQKLSRANKFLLFYFAIPALIFIFFFYPRLEMTITPQHTANMFYFPYDSLQNGMVLLRDYPLIFRSFLSDTGFISFFKLFGVSIYKARLFLRLSEVFVIIIFYFSLLRALPWYFVLLLLTLIRTNYLWFNFTAFNADWPTHIRYIYADLLIFALILFFRKRERIFLYFAAVFLPLTLLNSPDSGYSLIPAAITAVLLYFILERREAFAAPSGFAGQDKLCLFIFALSALVFGHIIFTLLSCVKFTLCDYLFIVFSSAVFTVACLNYLKPEPFFKFLNKPVAVIASGLLTPGLLFLYYLARIKSLGKFFYLLLKMPFFQFGITSVAQAHFNADSTYHAPALGRDIGYFMSMHLPVLACYGATIFIIHQFCLKKKRDNFLLCSLVFLTVGSALMYMRSMVLGEPLKTIYSMHFAWFLLAVLLFYLWRMSGAREVILYGLFLINFIPTLPLISSKSLQETNLFLHHNNFYITTLDAELRYAFKRNIEKEYLDKKFQGYFGSLKWFQDYEDDLYRVVWAEESIRIIRRNYGLEKQSDIDRTLWPRREWRYLFRVAAGQQAGRTVSFGWWLKAEAPGRVRVLISDSRGNVEFSAFHPGKNEWKFLTVTKKLNDTAGYFLVGMQITPGPLIFAWEEGPQASSIGPFALVEGERVAAPELKLEACGSMPGLLWSKVFLEEVNSYLK